MKIISLNTWGGRVSGIDDFIRGREVETDIFCFQEVHNDGAEAQVDQGERPDFFDELRGMLPGHVGYFSAQVPGTGLAAFVREGLVVANVECVFMLGQDDVRHLRMCDGSLYYPRIVQIVRVKEPHMSIFNFHGVPGNEKKDSPERALQGTRLNALLDSSSGTKILAGDFNLRPDTNAIRDLEKKLRNLVVEFGFPGTRTNLYGKKLAMPFADYMFVTSDVRVVDFKVLPDVISDHSPLYLEGEIVR